MTRDQRESIAWDEVMEGLNQLEAAVRIRIHAPTTFAMFAALDAENAAFDKLKAARARHEATIAGVA